MFNRCDHWLLLCLWCSIMVSKVYIYIYIYILITILNVSITLINHFHLNLNVLIVLVVKTMKSIYENHIDQRIHKTFNENSKIVKTIDNSIKT